MNKKSVIVGWHCYLDHVGENVDSLKGEIIKTDEYGVVLRQQVNNNPDRDVFVPWIQIRQIVHRP